MNTKRILIPETVPLVQWDDGSIRARESRVTLDTIVSRFKVGDTMEEIQDGFPSLTLTQIKEIIAWYSDNRAVADEYLRERYAEGERIRREIESQPEYKAFREKFKRYRAQLSKR